MKQPAKPDKRFLVARMESGFSLFAKGRGSIGMAVLDHPDKQSRVGDIFNGGIQ